MKITVYAVDTDDTDDFEAPMVTWATDGDGDLHVYEGTVTEADLGVMMETATFARKQWRHLRTREAPVGEGDKAVWRRAQDRTMRIWEK